MLPNMMFLVSYITGMNSFQKPLSAGEEREYLERYREGDIEAKNILIERNLRLVAHVVKKYTARFSDTDDLISIGTIGLIKGISTYNPKKGTRLATYAAKCIDNEILMNLRSNKKLQNEVMLLEPIGTDKEGNEITLIDKLSNDEETVFDEVDLKLQIRSLYRNMQQVLFDRERVVLELRYGLNNGTSMTQKEIAKMMGISRSYVSRIEKKAVKKLLCKFRSDGE
ncbi:MAG: RNA polymerase sporulation sigma factor SigK [Ruminococcaceae bacterium]|nr:RNA polymerase sporulation sigma factor SigK [Oscillospiraceae bacterium]